MRRTLHRMLKDAFEGKLGVFREPFVYGFTTRTREARGELARPVVQGQEIRPLDPVADVILTESAIFVTAEMPGSTSDQVRVKIELGQLLLESEGERRYYSSIDLPADVDRDTLKYTFTNGVLDVVIARRHPFL
ncbi:MAG TPA: Hsp20/alpha crystallin family protein [Thermoplasmata archaeon]|nr:Hsp20/alpha crystallin family protein [Thermoplasmata archaeon]